MAKKRKGIFVDDDSWQKLKVFCVQNKLNIVDMAGEIVEEWVAAKDLSRIPSSSSLTCERPISSGSTQRGSKP